MNYFKSIKLQNVDFNQAIEKVTEALQQEGFGILTQVDVKETLKKKLDVDFRPYRILGACNPPFAYKALKAEKNIGTMLPCNVVVQEIEDGIIEVVAVNPIASMLAVKNPELIKIAAEIQNKLESAINKLKQ